MEQYGHKTLFLPYKIVFCFTNKLGNHCKELPLCVSNIFHVIEQNCDKYCAKATYFLYCRLIELQFAFNFLKIFIINQVDDNGIKVKTMEYTVSHKNSFKWPVKDDILYYDTPLILALIFNFPIFHLRYSGVSKYASDIKFS